MRTITMILAAAIIALTALPTHAGGPLTANGTTARRYPAGSIPISFKTDQGALGSFSNGTATGIAVYAFQQWDNVVTAALSFNNAGQLPRDVTTAADAFISGAGQFSDGVNPVVFDNDGSITDAKLGVGARNSVLGFASSAYAGNNYVEGYAIINGFLSGAGGVAEQDEYKATITHEIGHFLGLGHSQVSMHADYATMYPVIEKTAQKTLSPDDQAAISILYPAAGYTATVGGITGTVRRLPNTSLSGVNVIAEDSATGAAYSTVVDYFSGGKSGFDNAPAATGTYTFTGLPPGRYFVRIEPVTATFTGGSSVASYDTPANMNIDREWYNGTAENGDMLLDNVNEKTGVVVAAGATTSNISFLENESITISSLVYHDGTPYYLFDLPQAGISRYAVRFTAPGTGSLVGVKFKLGAGSVLPLNGTLTVTVHANAPGSVAGVPGTALGSVTIPYSDIAADQNVEVYLRGIGLPINFPAGTNFHVSLSTNGVGTLELFTDNGSTTQNRTSYYNGTVWRNFPEGGYQAGYNLVMSAVYSSSIAGTPQPALSATPTSLQFGRVRPGNSITRTVTVTNTGTGLLTVNTTPILGRDSLDYSVTAGKGPFTVDPGLSHDISVRFTPRDAGGVEDGTKSAMMAIVSNAATSPDNVPLSGRAVAPLVMKVTSAVDFGSRRVGGTYIIDTVLFRNAGNDTLHVTGVTALGPDDGSGLRLLNGSGATIVPPDSSFRARIQFTPTERRIYTLNLRIVHDDPKNTPTDITIAGRGVAAIISTAGTFSVGRARVGTTIDAPPLFVRNSGDIPVRITSLTISGANATEFIVLSPVPPVTLAPGDSLPIRFRFHPMAIGIRVATLQVGADSLAPISIQLNGEGIQGALSFRSAAVDFGDVPLASNGERDIAVVNSGTDTATISSADVTGSGFSLVTQSLAGRKLLPGDSVIVRVRFAPTVAGTSSGSLRIASNGSDPLIVASLSGRGTAAGLTLNRTRVDFGAVATGISRTDSFTVRNTGNAPLTGVTLTLTGPDAAAFEIISPTPLAVSPGGAQTVLVRLKPQASERALSAGVVVQPAGGSSAEVTLSATIGSGIAATVAAVDFGSRLPGGAYDTTVVIRNITSGSITISSIAASAGKDGASGDYFRSMSPAPVMIPPNDSIAIVVRFSPAAGTGRYTGSLAIAVNGSAPLVISLVGRASAVGGVADGIVAGEGMPALLPVAPNPAAGVIEIGYRAGGGMMPVEIVITDAIGREVAVVYQGTATRTDERVRFNTSPLPSGRYYVLLRSARGSVTQPLVIVK
ncbi:MAG: Matrixin [Chlorobi bacterium]|nr:Matrixin [Chlorobiota bacterium]